MYEWQRHLWLGKTREEEPGEQGVAGVVQERKTEKGVRLKTYKQTRTGTGSGAEVGRRGQASLNGAG